MSVEKLKRAEDIIREHASGFEESRDSLLEKAKLESCISKKIELCELAEEENVSIRNMYVCIGNLASEVANQKKNSNASMSTGKPKCAEYIIRERICELETERDKLLRRAETEIGASKKFDLYIAARRINEAISSLYCCIGKILSGTTDEEREIYAELELDHIPESEHEIMVAFRQKIKQTCSKRSGGDHRCTGKISSEAAAQKMDGV